MNLGPRRSMAGGNPAPIVVHSLRAEPGEGRGGDVA